MEASQIHRDNPGTFIDAKIVMGTVIGAFPFANCYMVAFGDGEGRAVRPCLYVGSLGNFGLGAREFANLMNGTQVVVATTVDQFDYIIAAVPLVVTNPGATPVDFLAQAAGAHFYTEEIFRFPCLEQDGVVNASVGGVADSLPGEWGVINELGLGTFVGRFEAFLRADEMNGLWVNYATKSVRLAAQHYFHQTYAEDTYDGFADGELNLVRKRAAYPGESVGVVTVSETERTLPVFTERTNREIVTDRDGTRGPVEPLEELQTLMPRILELEGRNADLLQRYVITPAEGASYLQDEPERYLGLLRERYGLDGSYQLHTKSTVSIRKVVAIPAPVDIQDLRAPVKDITDQDISDFDWSEDLVSNYGAAAFAAQALEYHAYIANLDGFRNLIGRSDWHVPEAQDEVLLSAEITPPVTPKTMWQQPDTPTDVPLVGSRQAQMYLANCGLDILADGTVVLDGPMGEQIIMGGGNIIFSCPGSVLQMPGQHAITWAPGDIIQRAKGHAELSTSDGDIRLKAERNLQALAGNGGVGGILMESKGRAELPTPGIGNDTEVAGIIIKSASAVRLDGNEVSARADAGGVNLRAENNGFTSITGQRVLMNVDDDVTIATGESLHYMSESLSVIDSANVTVDGNLSADGVLAAGQGLIIESGGADIAGSGVFIRGALQVNSQIVARSAVVGASFSPAKDLNKIFDEIIDERSGDNDPGNIVNVLSDAQRTVASQFLPVLTASDAFWLNYDESVGRLGFTFRRDTDYTDGHEKFALPEFRWQKWIRGAGSEIKWEEPQIEPPDVDGPQPTLPHPGLQTWNGQGLIVQSGDDGLWDSQAVLPSSRDSAQVAAKTVPVSDYIINTAGNA